MLRWYLALTFVLPLSAAAGQTGPASDVNRVLAGLDSNRLRTHLSVLAHDSLEGRAPDTPGGRKAGEYIARLFGEWGLSPAGDSGTFFHQFRFSIVRNVGSSIRFGRDSLAYGIEQVATTMGATERAMARGQVVFVGYGISSSEWDDYRGQDLEGKIAIALAGIPRGRKPENLPADAATRGYKTATASQHGARATLVVHRADIAKFPWREIPQYWSEGHVAQESPASRPRLDQSAASFWVSAPAAERLLQASGYTLDQLVEMANGDVRGPVALPLAVDLEVTNQVRPIHARNVVGRLPGSGPTADEVIVIGAHYDHLGIGPPVRGDSIYNGAEDNAGGTAQLLVLAEAFARSGLRPKRSLLFIGFDAEEIGLLGSQAFVRRPTVPIVNQVAMINLDAANLHGATRDIAALGLRESTLDRDFRLAAEAEDLVVPHSQPDSIEAFFLRSDQYRFAEAGVPAIFLFLGWDFVGRTPAWALEQWNRYFADRYHQPADEIQPWFSLAGAMQQARVVARMTLGLAASPDRPRWMDGSRFSRR